MRILDYRNDTEETGTSSDMKIHKYSSIQDAGFLEGNDIEIWYCKSGMFTTQGTSVKTLKETHSLLGTLACENSEMQVNSYLEKLFWEFQGENWSPFGEANNLIKSKGLFHTSMSVGDVIKIRHSYYVVCPFGFREIK